LYSFVSPSQFLIMLWVNHLEEYGAQPELAK